MQCSEVQCGAKEAVQSVKKLIIYNNIVLAMHFSQIFKY